jgi:hypothetical protein
MWLLRFLASGGPKHQRLGFTALRNCRQFPLAVLLGSAVTASGLENSQSLLGDLTTFSEDDAGRLERKGSARERSDFISKMETAFQGVSMYLRDDRRLARGMVITRPLRRETGFRYTGFLLVEESPSTIRGVPYRMSSLINRDDGGSSLSALELVSQPGRDVFVVYDTSGDFEAQVIYAVPFSDLRSTEPVMVRGSLSCNGLTVAVVVQKTDTGNGLRYRYITSTGRTDIVNRNYGAQAVELGNCWLLHESSPLALFSRTNISKSAVEQIVSRFIEKTALEQAAILQVWDKGFKLGGRSGRLEIFRGEPPQELVVLLEDKVLNEIAHTFPVSLPMAKWTVEDRTAVLQDFFTNNPATYAVVVALLKSDRGSDGAMIVHRQSGSYEFRKATAEIVPGTLVFWEEEEGKVYLAFLKDQTVVPDCGWCFDSGIRVCETCQGKGEVTCPNCDGSGKSPCGHCDGTGNRRSDCRGCRGTGYCGNCGGSTTITLNCKVCQGRGVYEDSGRTCIKCKGGRTFTVTCKVCTSGPQPSGKCPNCKGAGDFMQPCGTCGRTGRWNCDHCRRTGIAQCETCHVTLASSCRCGGSDKLRLMPATRRI